MIQDVLDDTLLRRVAGEDVSDSDIIRKHPSLSPELDEELRLLSVLERAATSSRSAHPTDVRDCSMIEPAGSPCAGPDSLQFAGYRVIRLISHGGQATVYEAQQTRTRRRVAIKVMREVPPGSEDSVRRRIDREVLALAQIDHPNVVKIIDCGTDSGRAFIVMDFVDGLPLDEHIAAREPSVRERVILLEKTCRAVCAAHQRGFVHRDLKPTNILVDETGVPHVLDFGFAGLTEEYLASQSAAAAVTQSGQFVGTLAWASPEQASRKVTRIDVRTDVHALGLLLFYSLTGSLPYPTDSGIASTLSAIATLQPPRPSSLSEGIHPDLDTVVLKCLCKEPGGRYQSAEAVADELQRVLEDRPVLARPPSLRLQIRSFCRRNRVLVGATSAVILALLVGVALSTLAMARAMHAEHAATSNAEAARNSLLIAEQEAYRARIAAAAAAISDRDVIAARSQLLQTKPELRDWEWGYAWSHAEDSDGVLPGPRSDWGSVAATVDGRLLLKTGEDAIEAIDPDSNQVLWMIRAHASLPPRFTRFGDRFVLYSRPNVLLYETDTGNPVSAISIPDSPPTPSVAVDPSGEVIAVLSRTKPGFLRLYRALDGAVLLDAAMDAPIGGDVSFAPDGETLLVGTDHRLTLIDMCRRCVERTWPLDESAELSISRVIYSPDGGRVFAVVGSRVEVVDATTGRRTKTLIGHPDSIKALAISPSGQLLATGGEDRTIRVWRPDVSLDPVVLGATRGYCYSLCFAGASSRLFSSSPNDGYRRVWNPSGGASYRALSLGDPGPDVYGVEFTRDSGRLFAAGGFRLLRHDIGSHITRLLEWDGCSPFALDPAGTQIAHAHPDGLRIWNLTDLSSRWTCPAKDWSMTRPGWSHDGKLIAVSTDPGKVYLWNAASRSLLRVIDAHSDRIERFSFAPDSHRLATASFDTSARIWDCDSGSMMCEYRGHSMPVTCADFSPDGTEVATAGDDHNIDIWDSRTGKLRLRIDAGAVIRAVAFHPDGHRIASGGADAVVRLWDVKTGAHIIDLGKVRTAVICLAWSPDGRSLAAGGMWGGVYLWDSWIHGHDWRKSLDPRDIP